MQELELKALGKINLGLDVLGKRENGYHDVRMIMQSVYLYDNVVMQRINEDEIQIKTNLFYLPINEKNIAYKAAKMLKDEFKIREGVSITLQKRIPVSAGMAGGSTDAAAVLYGMNRLFNLRLTNKGLMDRGVMLGADVPYCILRGTMLAEGIGEKLSPLSPMPNCYVLIAKPSFSVSTRMVYEKLDACGELVHPNIDAICKGLEENNLQKIAMNMGNVLEQVTIADYPVIEEIKNVMKAYGALNAIMSGSGPTVFGIFESKQKANFAGKQIRERRLANTIYTTTIHYPKRAKFI
jgi:4-diphosphocytidyl-2-C-methyl-D-erythritol kinase